MKMIEAENITDYICPHCGYIKRDRKGKDVECPKCEPDFTWKLVNIPEELQKALEKHYALISTVDTPPDIYEAVSDNIGKLLE